jgi:pilus assembly protein CpaC
LLVRVRIDTTDLETRIGQIFPGAEVRIRQVGNQLILEGQVPDSKTMSDVLQLVAAELRLRQVLSRASSTGQMPAQMNNQGGGMGNSGSTEGLIVPGTGVSIVNRVKVPGPRQVLLRVKIAELNRTAMRQLGISWLDTRNNSMLGSTVGGAAGITGTGSGTQNAAFSPLALLPQSVATPIAGRLQAPGFSPVASAFNAAGSATNAASAQLFGIFNAGEFNLFINALRSNSLAKILAEPNLVTLDGQPARFQAGGSFPYPVPQAGAGGVGSVITIQYAQFGAILSFIPHLLDDDIIRLDVEPNFSELNFGQGFAIPGTGGTVPGINQRNARTVVELRESQTLAIAGLLSTRTNATTTRIPGLGDLPVVGPWFSSNSIETVETELVVLVTPELVEPMEACDVPPGPGELLLEPNDWEFYFLGRIEGKTGHPYRATVQYQDPLNVMKHMKSEARWVIGPHGHAD